MITSTILTILKELTDFLLSPFLSQPDVVLPSDLSNAITNVQGFYNTLDPIFPVGTLLIVIGVVLTVELALFAYKAIMWIIRKIPGIS